LPGSLGLVKAQEVQLRFRTFDLIKSIAYRQSSPSLGVTGLA